MDDWLDSNDFFLDCCENTFAELQVSDLKLDVGSHNLYNAHRKPELSLPKNSHPTEVITPNCRFVLSKIIEDEVASEYGYDVFEPTVGLEIAGRNIFKELGLDGADRVVIIHFLEDALRKTLRLIDDISRQQEGEYEFWLLGNEYGIELQLRGNVLEVMLLVGYRHGLELDSIEEARKHRAGPTTVNDWVEAVIQLSKDLSDLFERLNPRKLPSSLESKRKALEHWLILHRSQI